MASFDWNRRGMLGALRMLAAPGERREAAVSFLCRPRNLFQPWTTTGPDRYPEEFALLREQVGAERPRILSFGCASGEELLTLRDYFPAAMIRGVDVNPLAVRAARRKVAADREIDVVRASDVSGEAADSYDVVLALAVFRHGALNESPPRCDEHLRFADFERTITELCAVVRPGGLLVVRHANFRFRDCAAAREFDTVRAGFESVSAAGLVTPVYGCEDSLLDPSARDDGIYRRRPTAPRRTSGAGESCH